MADIKDTATVAEGLRALGDLPATLQWMLFSAFVIWVIVWRGLAWWDSRSHARAKLSESARANELSENISRLCTVLEQHTSDEDNNAHRLNSALSDFSASMKSVSSNLQMLHERMSLKMSRSDSLTAIEDKLNDGVASQIMTIVSRSLRENNYAERSQFIRNKVKTAIGEVLEQAQRKLATNYHLSVELDPFFPTRDGSGSGAGIRHVLCDIIWDAIEALYRKSSPVEERVEEMQVIVGNLVADQFTTGVKSVPVTV